MLKKLIFLLLCLALVLTFVACGNDATIKFNTQGGTQINDVVVEKGSNIPKPTNPEKVGYTFDGWYVGDEEWSFIGYVVAEDMTLVAKWTPITYKITFEGNVKNSFIEYTIEDSITLPEAESDTFYMFDGWFEDEEFTKPIFQIEEGSYGDKTLYAKTLQPLVFELVNDTYRVTACDKKATTVTIPSTYNDKSVTSIGDGAFEGCSNLTSVTIPNTVTSIGSNAFGGCPIESATIPTTAISSIPKENLQTVIITGGTTIGVNAFKDCSNLKNITIGNSVTSIGDYAFDSCKSLKSVDIPNSVTSIGGGAFYHCDSLTSVTIPNGVTSIGHNTFKFCGKLANITIPNTVTSIGDDAFFYCYALASITIPDSVTSIGASAFEGCNFTSITIPDSVTSIGADAFWACDDLTSITLPNNLISISADMLACCSSLTSIIIPDKVTAIGDSAFFDCDSLVSIIIPDSVYIIGSDAFRGCSKLAIYCEATSKPSVWKSDWNKTNCPVYWYSEEKPSKNGAYWHYGENGEVVIWN